MKLGDKVRIRGVHDGHPDGTEGREGIVKHIRDGFNQKVELTETDGSNRNHIIFVSFGTVQLDEDHVWEDYGAWFSFKALEIIE